MLTQLVSLLQKISNILHSHIFKSVTCWIPVLRVITLKFEDWKTRFYKFEGYNPENGYPTRDTLEDMNMKKVADLLEKRGKLG